MVGNTLLTRWLPCSQVSLIGPYSHQSTWYTVCRTPISLFTKQTTYTVSLPWLLSAFTLACLCFTAFSMGFGAPNFWLWFAFVVWTPRVMESSVFRQTTEASPFSFKSSVLQHCSWLCVPFHGTAVQRPPSQRQKCCVSHQCWRTLEKTWLLQLFSVSSFWAVASLIGSLLWPMLLDAASELTSRQCTSCRTPYTSDYASHFGRSQIHNFNKPCSNYFLPCVSSDAGDQTLLSLLVSTIQYQTLHL